MARLYSFSTCSRIRDESSQVAPPDLASPQGTHPELDVAPKALSTVDRREQTVLSPLPDSSVGYNVHT